MLTQFEHDASIASQIEDLKANILLEKKAGVLVIINGSDHSAAAAYIGKCAVEQLNVQQHNSYSFMPYLLADELYTSEARYELVKQLNIILPIDLNIDDAVDELVLETEYMYKKLGVSRHMSIKSKQQLRCKLSLNAAEAMASDLNLLIYKNLT